MLLGCGAGTAAQLAPPPPCPPSPSSPPPPPSDAEDGATILTAPPTGWGQLPVARIAAGPTFVLALLRRSSGRCHGERGGGSCHLLAWGDARILTGGGAAAGELWQRPRSLAEFLPQQLREEEGEEKSEVTAIAAGWAHWAACTAAGRTITAGAAGRGQVGILDAPSSDALSPPQLCPLGDSGSGSAIAVDVACGMRHTLVVARDAGDNGSWTLYGFGSNNRGQLGPTASGSCGARSVWRPRPCRIAAVPDLEEAAGLECPLRICAQGDSSAALVTQTGAIAVWGRIAGRKEGKDAAAAAAAGITLPPPADARKWAQVALGHLHVVAVSARGKAYQWAAEGSLFGRITGAPQFPEGKEEEGDLGAAPAAVEGVKGRVIDVSCGTEHAIILVEGGGGVPPGERERTILAACSTLEFILMDEQTRVCSDSPPRAARATEWHSWGWNEHGQLGVGGLADASRPLLVPTPTGFHGTGVHAGAGFSLASGFQDDAECAQWIQDLSHRLRDSVVGAEEILAAMSASELPVARVQEALRTLSLNDPTASVHWDSGKLLCSFLAEGSDDSKKFSGVEQVVELGCGVAGYGGLALGQHSKATSVLFVDREPEALIEVAIKARTRGIEQKCKCLASSWTSSELIDMLLPILEAKTSSIIVASDVCYHTNSSRSLGKVIGMVLAQYDHLSMKKAIDAQEKHCCLVAISHTIRYSIGSNDNFDEPLYSFLVECESRNLRIQLLRFTGNEKKPVDSLRSPMAIAALAQGTSIVIGVDSL